MQIDTYTKVVLTVIAIGVGLLVFDQKPVKDAQAANASGDYMLSQIEGSLGVWHMDGNRVRYCYQNNCNPWK
jgi:hypothetical protein